jgi:enoyl-CoA hydratase
MLSQSGPENLSSTWERHTVSDIVSHQFENSINIITMDDGKANAMSNAMLDAINDALDQAETNEGTLILQGRDGIFSGGFDLGAFKRGDADEIYSMLKAGAELSERLLSFPNPSIAACTGHGIAMGAFTLLSMDYRIGIEGDYKFAANEVAIGLTVPHFATEVCRQRLSPAAYNMGLATAHFFNSASAIQAGFLDNIVNKEDLLPTALDTAKQFNQLDLKAHRATKLRIRNESLRTLRQAIEKDCANWKSSYSV